MAAFDEGVVQVLSGGEEFRPLESRHNPWDPPHVNRSDDIDVRRRPRHAEREDRNAPDEDMIHAARTQDVFGDPKNVVEASPRSEEHTSELQSQSNLVCRLLLEK